MFSRVAGIGTLGELDVLTATECDRTADTVLGLRDHWAVRSPHQTFFTLGVNAYMDLAQASEPVTSYDQPARSANRLLTESFAEVYRALAGALQDAMGLPVGYADDLALPGFHVWTAAGIPQRPNASLHFDLQYRRLLERPAYAGATGTVSFTLPIRLPAAGSSLRVWPGIGYPDTQHRVPQATTTEPLVVPYAVGRALVHSGHVLHQIGTTPTVEPDDIRITLQGHGLVIRESVVLYW